MESEYEIRVDGRKCQIYHRNDIKTYEVLSPPMEVVYSKLHGSGSMGSRWAPTLDKAEFYLTLRPFDDRGNAFITYLIELQRCTFRKWYNESGPDDNPFLPHSLPDILATLSPILNSSGTIKVKRKVCRFGTGEIAEIPIWGVNRGHVSIDPIKKMDFKPMTGEDIIRGDRVRTLFTFFPYSFNRRQGISMQLKGVMKIPGGKVPYEIGMDWSPWA